MKEVMGFPMYTLSRDGKVYSKYVKGGCGKATHELRELVQVLDGTGYFIVSLVNDGKKYKKSVHRLLAEHFIPNPEMKAHVNHIDGVKTNNNLDNLEWATPLENTQHAIRIGLKDASNPACQVSVSQFDLETGEKIAEYRSLSEATKVTGVAYPNIIKVCKGLRKKAGGFFWMYT